jgi:hypothetical protein
VIVEIEKLENLEEQIKTLTNITEVLKIHYKNKKNVTQDGLPLYSKYIGYRNNVLPCILTISDTYSINKHKYKTLKEATISVTNKNPWDFWHTLHGKTIREKFL